DEILTGDQWEQRLYQVARRAGIFEGFGDLGDPRLRARAEALLAGLTAEVGADRLEDGVRAMMERFV
ncbi:MAG: radical SAM protein, partial [Deltaproteobacteria bacterium]|nr:radical SAM protein [Deltaproteobacteria bacterium]